MRLSHGFGVPDNTTARRAKIAAARGDFSVLLCHICRLCIHTNSPERTTRGRGKTHESLITLTYIYLYQREPMRPCREVARAGVEEAISWCLNNAMLSFVLLAYVVECCYLSSVVGRILHGQGEAVGECPESQRGVKDSSPAERQKDPRSTARCDCIMGIGR